MINRGLENVMSTKNDGYDYSNHFQQLLPTPVFYEACSIEELCAIPARNNHAFASKRSYISLIAKTNAIGTTQIWTLAMKHMKMGPHITLIENPGESLETKVVN